MKISTQGVKAESLKLNAHNNRVSHKVYDSDSDGTGTEVRSLNSNKTSYYSNNNVLMLKLPHFQHRLQTLVLYDDHFFSLFTL